MPRNDAGRGEWIIGAIAVALIAIGWVIVLAPDTSFSGLDDFFGFIVVGLGVAGLIGFAMFHVGTLARSAPPEGGPQPDDNREPDPRQRHRRFR